MRKKIVAGNWKMNKNYAEGTRLMNGILEKIHSHCDFKSKTNLHTIIAPPFIFLKDFAEKTKLLDRIKISAQNCHHQQKGAFTGEISAEMIKSTGADYVIIGHSERRAYFKEDDAMLAKKVDIALENGLNPIFCIGEVLEQRNDNKHFDIIRQQLQNGIFHLSEDNFKKTIIAYEPVWAIGTGVNATPQQAQEMHAYIRALIKEKYSEAIANDTSILYGGSCNANNAKELFSNPDVDGGLIGGASLIAEDFIKIVNSI